MANQEAGYTPSHGESDALDMFLDELMGVAGPAPELAQSLSSASSGGQPSPRASSGGQPSPWQRADDNDVALEPGLEPWPKRLRRSPPTPPQEGTEDSFDAVLLGPAGATGPGDSNSHRLSLDKGHDQGDELGPCVASEFHVCQDAASLEPGWHPWQLLGSLVKEACLETLGRRPLHVATDCSGGDAPVFAWRSIQRCANEAGLELALCHEFSSEAPDAKHIHKFILANHRPRRLYLDMLIDPGKGGPGHEAAECAPLAAGGNVPLPEPGVVDVYDAGFECQDRSSRNQHQRPLIFDWDCPADPESGMSSRTLMASLHRIRALRPRAFRLENVGNCEMGDVMAFMAKAFPGYDLGLFQANAADFRCCTERDRQWLVGVAHGCLRAPFEAWEQQLLSLRSPRHVQSPRKHLLRHDSPHVGAEHKRLKASAVARQAAPGRQAAHCPGVRWSEEHDAIRCAMGPEVAPPMPRPLRPEEIEHSEVGSPWAPLYCPREADLVSLLAAQLAQQPAPAPDKTTFLDIGEGATHTRGLSSCLAPTLVTGHRVYWMEGARHLLGHELLFLLGFPHDLDPCGLSHRQLTKLAGNSMSVDFLACLSTLILLYVDFGPGVGSPACPRPGRTMAFKIPPHPLASQQTMLKVCLPGSRPPATGGRRRHFPCGSSSSLVPWDLPRAAAATTSQAESGPALAHVAAITMCAEALAEMEGAIPTVPLVGPAWRQEHTGTGIYIGLLGNSPRAARGGKQISGNLHVAGVRGRCRELLNLLRKVGVMDLFPGGGPCSGVAIVRVLPGTPLIPWRVAAVAGNVETTLVLGLPGPAAAGQMGTTFLWEPTPDSPDGDGVCQMTQLGPLPFQLVANSVKKSPVLIPCGDVMPGRFHSPPGPVCLSPAGWCVPIWSEIAGVPAGVTLVFLVSHAEWMVQKVAASATQLELLQDAGLLPHLSLQEGHLPKPGRGLNMGSVPKPGSDPSAGSDPRPACVAVVSRLAGSGPHRAIAADEMADRLLEGSSHAGASSAGDSYAQAEDFMDSLLGQATPAEADSGPEGVW